MAELRYLADVKGHRVYLGENKSRITHLPGGKGK